MSIPNDPIAYDTEQIAQAAQRMRDYLLERQQLFEHQFHTAPNSLTSRIEQLLQFASPTQQMECRQAMEEYRRQVGARFHEFHLVADQLSGGATRQEHVDLRTSATVTFEERERRHEPQ